MNNSTFIKILAVLSGAAITVGILLNIAESRTDGLIVLCTAIILDNLNNTIES